MADNENILDENIFDSTKKKKSKKRHNHDVLQETTAITVSTDNMVRGDTKNENDDFTYEYLISRVYEMIHVTHPDWYPDDRNRRVEIILPPPQLARIGTRRTSFMNFGLICKLLKRNEKLLHDYFIVESGTTASIDSKHALILRGRFIPRQIQHILRSFIKEYVCCKTCHSPDTLLKREDRLTIIKCNICQSQYSVSNIKTGFQSQTGRRTQET